jgi:hypothetical protein
MGSSLIFSFTFTVFFLFFLLQPGFWVVMASGVGGLYT